MSMTDEAGKELPRQAIQTWATPVLRPKLALGLGDSIELAIPTGRLRVWVMLGLWTLGERDTARRILEQELQNNKYAWLAQWRLRPSVTEAGIPTGILFGSVPSEIEPSRVIAHEGDR
jgi:hypothetical protein